MANRTHARAPSGVPLPNDSRAKLSLLVAQIGEGEACKHVAITPATLARALAGLNILRGTVLVIQSALEKPHAQADDVREAAP